MRMALRDSEVTETGTFSRRKYKLRRMLENRIRENIFFKFPSNNLILHFVIVPHFSLFILLLKDIWVVYDFWLL